MPAPPSPPSRTPVPYFHPFFNFSGVPHFGGGNQNLHHLLKREVQTMSPQCPSVEQCYPVTMSDLWILDIQNNRSSLCWKTIWSKFKNLTYSFVMGVWFCHWKFLVWSIEKEEFYFDSYTYWYYNPNTDVLILTSG